MIEGDGMGGAWCRRCHQPMHNPTGTLYEPLFLPVVDGWQEDHRDHEHVYWRGDADAPTSYVEFDDRVGLGTVEGDVSDLSLFAVLQHHFSWKAAHG